MQRRRRNNKAGDGDDDDHNNNNGEQMMANFTVYTLAIAHSILAPPVRRGRPLIVRHGPSSCRYFGPPSPGGRPHAVRLKVNRPAG